MLKISFSGIPGCGRSSLAEEVRKILTLKSRVEIIEEINRKNPFDDHLRSTFESQFFYLSTQINEENSLMYSPIDYILCDQSVLDQWVSWRCTYEKMNDTLQKKYLEHHNLMHTLFGFSIRSYDIFFFIRVSGDIYEKRQAENKLRKVDGQDQEIREKMYLKTVQEEKIHAIEVWNNTTIDETALTIIQHITEFQAQRKNKESEPTPPVV